MNIFPRLVLPSVLAFFTPLALASKADQKLDLIWVDVEGGGCVLIVTPNNESVLIDTGYAGGRDPGRIVKAAKELGVRRIDHLLLTHFHADHFGGAAEVAQELPVGTVHARVFPDPAPNELTAPAYLLLFKAFREFAADKRERLQAGEVIPLQPVATPGAPKLELRCVIADKQPVAPTPEQAGTRNPLAGTVPPREPDLTDNANSAGFMLQFGPFRFFDGGDLSWNSEEMLVSPHDIVGPVDVYQADHHGNTDASHPLLLGSLQPVVSIVNNGPRKGGDAPALARLKGLPATQAVFQLHKSLRISDSENTAPELTANGLEACEGNCIKLSVAADGKSYTVTIPATGYARTFATKTK